MYTSGKPSVIGCAQAQELGIVTVNIDEINLNDNQQSKLTKELIQRLF